MYLNNVFMDRYFDAFRNFDKESKNIYWVRENKEEKKVVLIYSIPGLSKDDIEVRFEYDHEHDKDVLIIQGERKDEIVGVTFPGNCKFVVEFAVKRINWKVKNGLLYVDLEYKDSSSEVLVICEE